MLRRSNPSWMVRMDKIKCTICGKDDEIIVIRGVGHRCFNIMYRLEINDEMPRF